MIYWRREGTQLEMKFNYGPWYKRLWRWVRRKKTTAGLGDYLFSMPPDEWPPGTRFYGNHDDD